MRKPVTLHGMPVLRSGYPIAPGIARDENRFREFNCSRIRFRPWLDKDSPRASFPDRVWQLFCIDATDDPDHV